MNQILISSKVYVTKELKRKQRIYQTIFLISILVIVSLLVYYFIAEKQKNEEELVSQDIRSQLDSSPKEKDDTLITDKVMVVALNSDEDVSDQYEENVELEKEDLTDYHRFVEEKAEWLEPFAEYMAIKESFDMKSWTNWTDEEIKRRHPEALANYREKLADKLEYHRVTQYLFDKQWKALKKYANEHHIQIIGDMPIYVAEDSVEMWATPHYFKTDEVGNAACVAGCPPDSFSPLGQLWGNPIYNWRTMKLDGFTWWIKRLKASFELFDVVRIDHFRGFAAYWEIPAGATDATGGEWVKGPGFDLFEAVKNELGDLPIIAEDLGFMDDAVIELREATGFPGMKILEFGFMGAQPSSTDLPHYYPVNSVSYTGTHDNDTVLGWYESATDEERDFCNRYLNRTDEPISYALLRSLYGSVSKMTIATMQDLLQLDTTARMNIPSTLGGNWVWRMQEGDITQEVEDFLLEITELYDRSNEQL